MNPARSCGRFTGAGTVQVPVRPPATDVETRTSSWPFSFKRPSCQTRYSWPVAGSTAGSGMMSPVRANSPGLSGSWMPTVCSESTNCCELHVSPRSFENTIRSSGVNGGTFGK